MKQTVSKGILLVLAMGASTTSWAQAGSGIGESGSVLTYSLITIAVLIFFFLIIQVSNNLLAIEAKQLGIDEESGEVGSENTGVFSRLFKPKKPDFLDESTPVTFLRRGHDIALEGEAVLEFDESVRATTFAVQPTDFLDIAPIPKLLIDEGDEVKAGDHLFF